MLSCLHLGGLAANKGGRARVDELTSEQRSETAPKAAQVRWGKLEG